MVRLKEKLKLLRYIETSVLLFHLSEPELKQCFILNRIVLKTQVK